jgi:hypothetical protein
VFAIKTAKGVFFRAYRAGATLRLLIAPNCFYFDFRLAAKVSLLSFSVKS